MNLTSSKVMRLSLLSLLVCATIVAAEPDFAARKLLASVSSRSRSRSQYTVVEVLTAQLVRAHLLTTDMIIGQYWRAIMIIAIRQLLGFIKYCPISVYYI